jgi:hypothetical protein
VTVSIRVILVPINEPRQKQNNIGIGAFSSIICANKMGGISTRADSSIPPHGQVNTY